MKTSKTTKSSATRRSYFLRGMRRLAILDSEWDSFMNPRPQVSLSPDWRKDYPDVDKMLSAPSGGY